MLRLVTKPHGRRPCSGTWTAPSSTPSPTGSAAEYRLAEQYGGTWDDRHALNLVGNDLLDSGVYIREHMGIDLSPERIVEELLDDVVAQVEVAVPFRPGRPRAARRAPARPAYPCALVTMSYARFVDPVLAALPPGLFDEVVTGDAVSRGKPHPEPYLTAARLLGVAPERLPGHRGLRAGHHQRGRGRLHGPGRPAARAGGAGRAAGAPRHARRASTTPCCAASHPSLASLSPCRCRSRTTP